MIASKHLRECIIRPALDQLQLYSLAAEELLVMTAATESIGGTYLMQNDAKFYPKGPALGIYQMEPGTYRDLWENFLRYNTLMTARIGPVFEPHGSGRLVYDLRFATMMARLQYYRFKESLPDAFDIDGLARYYKAHWNTGAGKATVAKAVRDYKEYIRQ